MRLEVGGEKSTTQRCLIDVGGRKRLTVPGLAPKHGQHHQTPRQRTINSIPAIEIETNIPPAMSVLALIDAHLDQISACAQTISDLQCAPLLVHPTH
jgi:hypothetical protein